MYPLLNGLYKKVFVQCCSRMPMCRKRKVILRITFAQIANSSVIMHVSILRGDTRIHYACTPWSYFAFGFTIVAVCSFDTYVTFNSQQSRAERWRISSAVWFACLNLYECRHEMPSGLYFRVYYEDRYKLSHVHANFHYCTTIHIRFRMT